MDLIRPDLSQVDSEVRAYIEALEAEVQRLRLRGSMSPTTTASSRVRTRPVYEEEEEDLSEMPEITEPAEPPTPINVISATASGIAKRTPRHLYTRQRRGGMGVFDLEVPGDEPISVVATADQNQNLLLITDLGRAFRLAVSAIPEAPVRGRGETIWGKHNLLPGEKLAAILPEQAQGYLALVGQRGFVRLLRHHVFGEYMKPGTTLFDLKLFGPLASACWTPGDGDLFIATRQGKAIRFSEKLVPPAGGPGIRLSDGDVAVGITGVYEDSGVFLLTEDGKGTIRLMEGFSANKAPGAGGKIAMATDHLVFAVNADEKEDIFIISRLSKIIRFRLAEVPAKEGVVQGVYCMSLRGDECTSAALSGPTNQ